MPVFAYKGIDASGKKVSAELDAPERRTALRKLKAAGIRPFEVVLREGREADTLLREDDATPPSTSSASGRALLQRWRSQQSLALPFLRKLLQLHQSGMPVGDAVNLMSQRLGDPQLKELARIFYRDLSEGRTLATSMRQQGAVFDPTLSYLIEAGEATGNLVPILQNIIRNLESRQALAKKVRSAMAYPILICCVAFGVIGIFLFFLLPRIQGMMDSLGGDLNLAARFMIGMSEFLLTQGPFVAVAVLVVALSLFQWRKTPAGRMQTDRWILRLPLISKLFYNADMCRLTNVLSTLLANGVNTTDSMRLAESTLNNRILRARFEAGRALVNDGASFSAALRKHGLLVDFDADILSISENTGSLVSGFDEIYRSHSEDLESGLHLLTNLVAGLALGLAFALVFILTLGIVLSILNMSQSLMG